MGCSSSLRRRRSGFRSLPGRHEIPAGQREASGVDLRGTRDIVAALGESDPGELLVADLHGAANEQGAWIGPAPHAPFLNLQDLPARSRSPVRARDRHRASIDQAMLALPAVSADPLAQRLPSDTGLGGHMRNRPLLIFHTQNEATASLRRQRRVTVHRAGLPPLQRVHWFALHTLRGRPALRHTHFSVNNLTEHNSSACRLTRSSFVFAGRCVCCDPFPDVVSGSSMLVAGAGWSSRAGV